MNPARALSSSPARLLRHLRRAMLPAFLLALPWTAQAADTALRAMLPEAIRSANEITVASNPSYPPFAFKDDSGAPSGIETALLRGIGEKLGVKMTFTGTEFASILPGVASDRFDVGSGGFYNTEERQKVVEFVNYMRAAGGIVVRKGNPEKIELDELCGHNVSASQGSYEAVNLALTSKKCESAGKPAIQISVFPGTPPQVVALKAGRIDAAEIAKPVAGYLVAKDNTNIESLPGTVADANGKDLFMGLAVKKGNVALAKAMQAALQSMIDDGSYIAILKQWNNGADVALTKATIN